MNIEMVMAEDGQENHESSFEFQHIQEEDETRHPDDHCNEVRGIRNGLFL